jgi:hypothetical protein
MNFLFPKVKARVTVTLCQADVGHRHTHDLLMDLGVAKVTAILASKNRPTGIINQERVLSYLTK